MESANGVKTALLFRTRQGNATSVQNIQLRAKGTAFILKRVTGARRPLLRLCCRVPWGYRAAEVVIVSEMICATLDTKMLCALCKTTFPASITFFITASMLTVIVLLLLCSM